MISAKNKKLENGFTLIEIIISLTIFFILSVILGTVFISIANLQEDVAGRNRQLSELNFALGYIHHSIANSQNSLPASDCIGANLNLERITNGIRFINKNDKCQKIFFYQPDPNIPGRLQTRISTTFNRAGFGDPIDITTDIITTFDISLEGNLMSPDDYVQPKIRIFITSDIEKLDIPMTVRRTISRIKLDD